MRRALRWFIVEAWLAASIVEFKVIDALDAVRRRIVRGRR